MGLATWYHLKINPQVAKPEPLTGEPIMGQLCYEKELKVLGFPDDLLAELQETTLGGE